ncbi:hypothetical protein RAS12_13500 [Achromobacter seleniivolatilans]|uniref:Uncharacterized protein n=1 Tax=Achromobacter seleniivolatilans TaxID=3047478 RepID=A0ABY9M8Q6_9BURK|nr:hypothetical protein [Achromobacter sp. R39]WMD23339.1 hypothetical protein RAS12_13500 [Achromobacter sp. R39]
MNRFTQQPRVETRATIELSEVEMRALKALVDYGPDAFLRNFYKVMGECYLRPHEAGIRTLFATVEREIPIVLRRADAARKAFALQDPIIHSRKEHDELIARLAAKDATDHA